MDNQAAMFSDLHKDAYGSRPSSAAMTEFLSMSERAQQCELQDLTEIIREDIERQQEAEADADASFDDHFNSIARQFGVDFHTAVRWDMDADEIDRTMQQDIEHYFYTFSLSFAKIKELTPQFTVAPSEEAA